MSYIPNPFKEGDAVICINEHFPVFQTTEEDKSIIGTMPKTHPKIGEQLVIDEILGEFLRFDVYDGLNFNWWIHTHFKKSDEMTEEDEVEAIVNKNVRLFNELRNAPQDRPHRNAKSKTKNA